MARLRIAYFCMESTFSVQPLLALMEAGHDVRFVMRPLGPLSTRNDPVLRRHRGFDVAMRRLLGLRKDEDHTNPFAVAADKDIPAWLCGSANTPQVRALLLRERVDLIVVAFFNQLLKESTLSAARLGAINLHPSLLPLRRGPAPLFWTFKDGDEETGLCFHHINVGEDDGNILHTCRVPLSFGVAGEDLVDDLATLAREHTGAVVARVADGDRGTPQDASQATRAPRPQSADLIVDPARPAKELFTFARGVGRWNGLTALALGDTHRVIDAVDLDEGRSMPGEHALVGDELLLGTSTGVVRLKVRP